MKQNIGQKMTLYPTPATVVGTVDCERKVNWLLVAHVGIVSHSKLLLSVHSSTSKDSFDYSGKFTKMAILARIYMKSQDFQ